MCCNNQSIPILRNLFRGNYSVYIRMYHLVTIAYACGSHSMITLRTMFLCFVLQTLRYWIIISNNDWITYRSRAATTNPWSSYGACFGVPCCRPFHTDIIILNCDWILTAHVLQQPIHDHLTELVSPCRAAHHWVMLGVCIFVWLYEKSVG